MVIKHFSRVNIYGVSFHRSRLLISLLVVKVDKRKKMRVPGEIRWLGGGLENNFLRYKFHIRRRSFDKKINRYRRFEAVRLINVSGWRFMQMGLWTNINQASSSPVNLKANINRRRAGRFERWARNAAVTLSSWKRCNLRG
jgi:hypothetical protein